MKLLILLTTIACLQTSARGFGQSVTLSLKDAPLEKAFKEIKRQTGYSFVYTRVQLKNAVPVTCELNNESLKDALELCFRDQPLSFLIEDSYIVVQTKAVVVQTMPSNPALIDISGKIINENGEALGGVTILAKKSNKTIQTNDQGGFSLKEVDEDDLLVISSVGYFKQEVRINKQAYFLIKLQIKVGNLEETIIKGYYSTSRRLNTGAVNKVTNAEICSQPVSNPLAALQGRIPGLIITQANGLPGSNFSVRIRGQNSIQNGNSPFYIIDGVPFLNDADVLTQRSGINAASPFNTIDPSDIESIEVLKDADATAIYGSRGANGVILITTKKGKAGKTTIDLNVYNGWGKVSRTLKYLNTTQYFQMRREALSNDAVMPDVSNAYDLVAWDTTKYTDLKKILIGNTARINNVVMQMTGGNEFIRFSAGANYYRETTVFPGDNADNRVAFNLNLSHRSVNNKFSATISTSYANDKSNLIRQDLTQFVNLPPNIPDLYDSTGKLNWSENGFSFNNPLANTLRQYNVQTNRLTANAVLEYNIIKELKLKINLGYNDLHTDEVDQIPIASQNPAFSPLGSAFFGESEAKTWIVEPQIDYKKLFKKSSLLIQAGSTFQENAGKIHSTTATGYSNDYLLNSTVGAQTINSQVGSQRYHYAAVFGHLNYTLSERYIINLTGRRDGSSKFGPGRQFANFWAIGAGWIFSQESFFQKKNSFLSYGKLRGSYGTTGNDLIGNYQYLDLYAQTQYPYGDQPSLFPVKLYNSDYSWEEIRKLDIGLELGFIKDRILITGDWFKDKSKNQIIYYSLPGQTGFNNVLKNFPGVVENTGIELSLNSTNIKSKHFTWQTQFNITWQKNKLVEFPGLESSSYADRYIIGKPLNIYTGAIWTGVDPQTGVYQFLDKDKNPTSFPSSADYTYLGTTDPKFFGGIQNNFQYKGWQFDFLFEFKKQRGIHPVYSSFSMVGNASNQPAIVLNRWQKPGDVAPYERFTQTFGSAGIASFYLYNSSAILTDASYCRLKNLSLSYSLPVSWLSRSKIEKCRLYIQGQNLFVITNYIGNDPETQSLYALPPLKRFVAGLQITF